MQRRFYRAPAPLSGVGEVFAGQLHGRETPSTLRAVCDKLMTKEVRAHGNFVAVPTNGGILVRTWGTLFKTAEEMKSLFGPIAETLGMALLSTKNSECLLVLKKE